MTMEILQRTPPSCAPDWNACARYVDVAGTATEADVRQALRHRDPGTREFAALLSPAAAPFLETMAQRALAMTRRQFGRTISLYVPLYLSNFCNGGCAYCGFAADRSLTRCRLENPAILEEVAALKAQGFEDVLLLTGEETPQADFDYLRACVALVSGQVHHVTVEAFGMTTEQYAGLSEAGCTGVTLYQETYDPERYEALHRWGAKRDYPFRTVAPARALSGGMRTVGMGVLLGITEPVQDLVCLYEHVRKLQKTYWKAGFSVSFPRIRHQLGGFESAFEVTDHQLAQMIFAFRICLPQCPLVLSTRENPAFRDGMAGVGISRMSVASRTTVGGYSDDKHSDTGQFDVSDDRDVETFCAMLKARELDPVFKNWDSVFTECRISNKEC
jgi:2-iminoacetate synthase